MTLTSGPELVYDGWINLPSPDGEVAADPAVTRRFGNSSSGGGQGLDDVVAEMDRLGIAMGVLTAVPYDVTPAFVAGIRGGERVVHETCGRLAREMERFPGRFVGSVGLDPRLGYEAARHVRIAKREYGIGCVRILPMFTGLAIDDPLAYPLYTAACDEGVVVSVNVGVPGPMKPAKLQRTILVDDVALCFPDLTIVLSHLGDPWIGETIAMLARHPNVYAMTAGWAPKYVPEELRRFVGSRGRDRLMWASDYPVLSMERTITEGRALDVRPEALPGYLGRTALAVFGLPAGRDDIP